MDNNEKYLETATLYKDVFNTEKGKKVLWDLMKASGYTSTNFDDNPYKMAFNEGLRSMVIRIIKFTELDASKLQEMMKVNRKADSYERQNFDG